MFAVVLAAAAAGADELDLIGYTAVAPRLSGAGDGVPVAQVEVPADGAAQYVPDTAAPSLAGKTFVFRSGAGTASVHASEVASFFYGANGPASGVTNVALFTADSFIANVLRAGRTRRAPGGAGAAVVNNSWVGSYNEEATNVDVVRRLDHLVARDGVLVFNAMHPDPAAALPKLMGTSYNGISVGILGGSHGPVAFDAAAGGGRLKPDLVVGIAKPSDATALASGAAAVLKSEAAARGVRVGQLAVKSMLMAGAERDAGWRRGRPSGKDNATAPLDFEQGAGQLRLDRSFDILTAGRYTAGAVAPETGWDTARMPRGQTRAVYRVQVARALAQWSAVLSWNREIAGLNAKGRYDSTPAMADFSMSLLAGKKGWRTVIAHSDSAVDNVETLTLTDLPAGVYTLVLETDVRSYYGLSWIGDETAVGPAGVGFAGLATDVGRGGEALAGFASVPEPVGVGVIGLGVVILSGGRAKRERGTLN